MNWINGADVVIFRKSRFYRLKHILHSIARVLSSVSREKNNSSSVCKIKNRVRKFFVHGIFQGVKSRVSRYKDIFFIFSLRYKAFARKL